MAIARRVKVMGQANAVGPTSMEGSFSSCSSEILVCCQITVLFYLVPLPATVLHGSLFEMLIACCLLVNRFV